MSRILVRKPASADHGNFKAAEPQVDRKAAVLVLDIHKSAGPWYSEPDGYSYSMQKRLCWFLGKVVGFGLPIFLFAYQPDSPFGTEEYLRSIDLRIIEAAGSDARIIVKTGHDAFESSKIDSLLRELGITDLAVIGMNQHQCVLETTQGAKKAGYSVLTSGRLMYGAPRSLGETLTTALFYMFKTRCHVTAGSLVRELELLSGLGPDL